MNAALQGVLALPTFVDCLLGEELQKYVEGRRVGRDGKGAGLYDALVELAKVKRKIASGSSADAKNLKHAMDKLSDR